MVSTHHRILRIAPKRLSSTPHHTPCPRTAARPLRPPRTHDGCQWRGEPQRASPWEARCPSPPARADEHETPSRQQPTNPTPRPPKRRIFPRPSDAPPRRKEPHPDSGRVVRGCTCPTLRRPGCGRSSESTGPHTARFRRGCRGRQPGHWCSVHCPAFDSRSNATNCSCSKCRSLVSASVMPWCFIARNETQSTRL